MQKNPEGEPGDPSSGAGFARLTGSLCSWSLPPTSPPICRAEAIAAVRASVPHLMPGPPSFQAFAQAVPSAWSALLLLLRSEQLPLLKKHRHYHPPFFRQTARPFLVFPHSGCAKQLSHCLVGVLACETPLSLYMGSPTEDGHWFQSVELMIEGPWAHHSSALSLSFLSFCFQAQEVGCWVLWGVILRPLVRHETSDEWIRGFSCSRE